MKEVFADTFYFIALLNPRDPHHGAAVEATDVLSPHVVTSNWVLAEVADALSAPNVRQRTARFIRGVLEDPDTTVIEDEVKWFEQGLDLFQQRLDKSWSLTDCISFQIMHARGIREALTGDQHFVQAGFVALLAK
jgi:predicted nucleic acid-binding protein